MKNILLKPLNLMSIIIMMSILMACPKKEEVVPLPVAYFQAEVFANFTIPTTITFNNLSVNADSYFWTYPGGTSTDKDLTLIFKSAGSYTITLKATNKAGTDTDSQTFIFVAPVSTTTPTASFTYSPNSNLVAPAKITFTNTSKNADTYKWDFGDGTTSTTESPVKEFTKAGTYKVKLTASNKSSSNESSIDIAVNNPIVSTTPAASFTYSPNSNLVAPAKITFTNTSKNANSYKWDFGDGTTSTDTNPIKEFSKAGDYSIKLTATDTKNQSNQVTNLISVKNATSTTPTTSNINPSQYVYRYNSSIPSKDAFKPYPFTLTKSTPVVVMYTSRYTSQAALLSANEYNNFINNAAFQGQAVYDKKYGYQFMTLAPGTYYPGVRDVGGNKDNYYCYQIYHSTQIPASDRCEFVDIYINNLKTLNAGEYLYHKFTVQDGFRYVFNGCYSSWNMRGYFISESQLNTYTSSNGTTFQYFKDYVAGADGTLAVDEIKLPAGNYYFVFKNTSSSNLPLNITYFMERYRRL